MGLGTSHRPRFFDCQPEPYQSPARGVKIIPVKAQLLNFSLQTFIIISKDIELVQVRLWGHQVFECRTENPEGLDIAITELRKVANKNRDVFDLITPNTRSKRTCEYGRKLFDLLLVARSRRFFARCCDGF